MSVGQLHLAGLTKQAIARRVRKGFLHPLHRGVYALGHMALTRRSWEWAAVLAYGADAVLSHTTAGALWDLTVPEKAIEVSTRRALHRRRGIVVHRTRALARADRAIVDGVPVTSLHRTLVDLAEVLPEGRLAKAVHEAEVRRLLT